MRICCRPDRLREQQELLKLLVHFGGPLPSGCLLPLDPVLRRRYRERRKMRRQQRLRQTWLRTLTPSDRGMLFRQQHLIFQPDPG